MDDFNFLISAEGGTIFTQSNLDELVDYEEGACYMEDANCGTPEPFERLMDYKIEMHGTLTPALYLTLS